MAKPRFSPAGALLGAAIALLPLARAMAAQDLPGQPVAFPSHGANLQGRFFRAPGAGTHPTLLLLHGYPGGPGDVLGLGTAVSGAGWNALVFNYRGFHGSEGRSTPLNSMEDVGAALTFLRDSAPALRVDTGRIAILGYSYGGWLALMTGGRPAAVKCVALVAPGNLGLHSPATERDTVVLAAVRRSIEGPILAGRIRSMPYDSLVAYMREHGPDLDSTHHAAELAGKPVLVVGGWNDRLANLGEFVLPVVRALRAAGNTRVTPVTLDDDHAFRATRAELHHVVLDWLEDACARGGQRLAPAAPPAR